MRLPPIMHESKIHDCSCEKNYRGQKTGWEEGNGTSSSVESSGSMLLPNIGNTTEIQRLSEKVRRSWSVASIYNVADTFRTIITNVFQSPGLHAVSHRVSGVHSHKVFFSERNKERLVKTVVIPLLYLLVEMYVIHFRACSPAWRDKRILRGKRKPERKNLLANLYT